MKQYFGKSFRPLTGTLLSKRFLDKLKQNLTKGFRPLTGTLLSKRFFNARLQDGAYEFPSPHGDSLI